MLRSRGRQWILPLADLRQLALIRRLPRLLAEWRGSRRMPDTPVRSADGRPGAGKQGGGERVRRELGREAPFDPHHFYAAAWLGRLVAKARPSIHADIGSRVTDVGILSAFVPVIFLDGRPPYARMPGLASVAGDITRLPFPDKSMISLSSLNVIGRGAGRSAAEAAAIEALGELQRVLGYRGSLYLSVAVGRERVIDGQRSFAPETILRAVPSLRLRRFSYVGDDRTLHTDALLDDAAQQNHACGLFEFERA